MFRTLLLALFSFLFCLFTILCVLGLHHWCVVLTRLETTFAEHDGCISMIVDENIMPLFPTDETVQRLEEPWRVIQIDIGSSGIPCTWLDSTLVMMHHATWWWRW